jgi:large subunit ribosomal protein L25
MEILAKEREIKKVKPKRLRKEGFIPGIVFSKKSSQGKEETMPVTLNFDEFVKIYAEAGESTLISLKTDGGKAKNTLISDVQIHPITMDPIHVSFFEVDMKQEITATVPVEIINADDHPKVKSNEGIIITIISEIEVTCLPNDLPRNFEVDALQLKEVGDVLTLAQSIKVDPEKIKIDLDPEEVVLKLDFAEQIEAPAEEDVTGVEGVAVISEEEAKARDEAAAAEGEGAATDNKELEKKE